MANLLNSSQKTSVEMNREELEFILDFFYSMPADLEEVSPHLLPILNRIEKKLQELDR